MKQNPKLEGASSKHRSLTSLNQIEFDELLKVFSPLVEKKLSRYTLKGKLRKLSCFTERKNSSLYGCARKLEFILMYLKENPNQSYHGYAFGMSQSKVSEWVYFLSPILEESLKKLALMPQTGTYYALKEDELDYLLMDVTERRVPRRTDLVAQKEEYSGKKKCHTIKNLAITDPNGYFLFLSDSYEGRIHDKAIWDDLIVENFEQNMLVDLGFLGIDNTHPNAILPFKKPRNGTLTQAQKQINKVISQKRIRIEHAFAGLKCLKIIRNKIRLKSYDIRERIIRIATALHNLRIRFRQPIINHS